MIDPNDKLQAELCTHLIAAQLHDGVDFSREGVVIRQTVSKRAGWFSRKKVWERTFQITIQEVKS